MSEFAVTRIEEPKIVVANTIIVGIKFKGGIMMATDIRPNGGTPIANIHRLHDNIYGAVTGVGQDTCALVNVLRSKLEMHYMTTNYRRVPVRCASHMTRKLLHSQSCSLNVNVLIGGVDNNGTAMYSTRFDGSSDTVPFTAIGSGLFSAMAVLESRWRIGLDEASARDIIYEAVVFATSQFVESQSPVRLCIIKNDFSVAQETLGSVVQVQAPKPLLSLISQFIPKILHERVERVSRVSRVWKTESSAAEEKGEVSGVEMGKREGQEKIDGEDK